MLLFFGVEGNSVTPVSNQLRVIPIKRLDKQCKCVMNKKLINCIDLTFLFAFFFPHSFLACFCSNESVVGVGFAHYELGGFGRYLGALGLRIMN